MEHGAIFALRHTSLFNDASNDRTIKE